MRSELPGIRRRLASGVYDAMLLVGVVMLLFLAPYVAIGLIFHVTPPGPLLAIHLIAIFAAYFLWYWRHGGQTLAMQTWKIRLVSVTGEPPSWRQLILRFVLACFSVGFYGAGLLWAVFDRDRQFLHDRLAGTRIIFKR